MPTRDVHSSGHLVPSNFGTCLWCIYCVQSSPSLVIPRALHLQNLNGISDPVIIERTIGLVLGPSTALYEPFLKHFTLTNKAVGTIWRALSKPPQRWQDPDLCPLWLLVGTPSAIIPELAFSRATHSRPYSDVAKYIYNCIYIYILFINYAVCVLIFMTTPLGVAVGLLSI